jgi:hypothetical protein
MESAVKTERLSNESTGSLKVSGAAFVCHAALGGVRPRVFHASVRVWGIALVPVEVASPRGSSP